MAVLEDRFGGKQSRLPFHMAVNLGDEGLLVAPECDQMVMPSEAGLSEKIVLAQQRAIAQSFQNRPQGAVILGPDQKIDICYRAPCGAAAHILDRPPRALQGHD